uniref:Neuferricin n=1 Tax=Lygus hesperus TaxID=30085 RepID=A0A0A9YZJ6_LYGHE
MIKFTSLCYLMSFGAAFYFISQKIDLASLNFDHYLKFADPFWLMDLLKGEELFTKEDLATYDGTQKRDLYLSVLGKVYDVSKGRQYYGPGESYHGFVGKDASKAFVTGDFSTGGLSDDVDSLHTSELEGLIHWVELYEKNYPYKGKLIGRFYKSDGTPTKYLQKIHDRLAEGKKAEEIQQDLERRFPPCNLEWSAEKGKIVWCSNKSGGIAREWIGVPRKFFLNNGREFRCACIQPGANVENNYGYFVEYGDCPPDSDKCYLRYDED